MYTKRTKALLLALWCCVGLSGSAAYAASVYEQAEEARFHRDYDSAIDLYKRSLKDEPDHAPAAANRLFGLYVLLHRYDEAAEFLREVVKLTGDDQYTTQLANLMRDGGRHYEAQRLYRERLAAHPDDADALYGLGVSLEATGNFDEATDVLSRAVTAGGGAHAEQARQHIARMSNAAHGVKIDVGQEIGRWPAAAMPLKVFIEDGRNVAGYQMQLRDFVVQAMADWTAAGHGLVSFIEVGDKDKADIVVAWAPQLQDALGIAYPVSSEHALKRARIVFATNVDESGCPLPPQTPATRQLYEARDRMVREVCLHEFGHALGLEHSTRTDDIMAPGIFGLNSRDVVTARSLKPGDIERLQALYTADVTAGNADNRQAETSDTTAKVSPALPQPTSAGQRHDGTPARSAAAHASFVTPSSDDGAIEDAMFKISGGDFQGACDALMSLLKCSPNNAKAHYLLAVTLVNLRDYAKATQQYHEVLRLVPSGRLADLANEGLAKIKE